LRNIKFNVFSWVEKERERGERSGSNKRLNRADDER